MGTLIGMSFVGYFIIRILLEQDFLGVLLEAKVPSYPVKVVAGTVYGLITVFAAIMLVKQPNMEQINEFFGELIQRINPSFGQILFYSFCAGVGEEILFRGAIQPLLGIWPTAIIFVLLHGYINITQYSTTVYGVFLVFVAAGFGYLDNSFGILAPIVAHFVFDVVMFMRLKKTKLSKPVLKTIEDEV